MEISTTRTQSSTATSSTEETITSSASDYQTFLKMLTTQLENQDPLNPMESTDFAVQLATFSSVEQQTRTNDLLTELNGQFTLLGMSQLASWVGQEALTTADVWFDGDPVTLLPEADENADNLVLVVRDGDGNLVSRETVPVDGESYLWLGADAAGDALPEGRYSLSLENRQGEEVISTVPVQSYAAIEEARRDGDDITLLLRGGIAVLAEDIIALRA